jgi:hypothetical protein
MVSFTNGGRSCIPTGGETSTDGVALDSANACVM